MFIQGNKETGFKINLDATDMIDSSSTRGGHILGGHENIQVLLSAEKAKELEDRLEEVVNPKSS